MARGEAGWRDWLPEPKLPLPPDRRWAGWSPNAGEGNDCWLAEGAESLEEIWSFEGGPEPEAAMSGGDDLLRAEDHGTNRRPKLKQLRE